MAWTSKLPLSLQLPVFASTSFLRALLSQEKKATSFVKYLMSILSISALYYLTLFSLNQQISSGYISMVITSEGSCRRGCRISNRKN